VHELPHAIHFGNLLEELFGEATLLLPAHMLRICFPEGPTGSSATPYHQDFGGSQGSERALTVWCPLDHYMPVNGTLAIAGRRHREGLFRPRVSARGVFEIHREFAVDEVSGSISEGDILIFTAFTPHRALSNRSGRVRLSIDFRIQPCGDPVSEMFVGEYCPIAGCSWDKLYAAMPELPVALHHYWRGRSKWVYAHNNQFLEQELIAAIDAGEDGELAALPVLRCALEGTGVPSLYCREARRLCRKLMRSRQLHSRDH
jgi:hypothetical protein